jgi:hypothetical protein
MEKYSEDELMLIYIHKTGYNSNNEGNYEFIFSHDPTNIDIEGWNWDRSPACDNVIPPTKDYYDKIISFKTKKFDLFCLHEAVDREYMHGFYTIHALAYEVDDNTLNTDDYEELFQENNFPKLVFHYGISLSKVKELLYERDIIFNN